jgi:hypothetical protein
MVFLAETLLNEDGFFGEHEEEDDGDCCEEESS